jgi:hypothetical protein
MVFKPLALAAIPIFAQRRGDVARFVIASSTPADGRPAHDENLGEFCNDHDGSRGERRTLVL